MSVADNTFSIVDHLKQSIIKRNRTAKSGFPKGNTTDVSKIKTSINILF